MIAQLVSNLRHAHQAGVHAEQIEFSFYFFPDGGEHVLQLHVIEKIFRVVVVGDRPRF